MKKNKICGKCKKHKKIECFSLNRAKPDGRSNNCKICHRIIRKIYYNNNKKKECKRVSDRKRKLTEWFNEFKKTLKCEKCLESNTACLDFHHKNQSEKEINICEAANRGWCKEKILKEINKCIVLCANCHRKLHASVA